MPPQPSSSPARRVGVCCTHPHRLPPVDQVKCPQCSTIQTVAATAPATAAPPTMSSANPAPSFNFNLSPPTNPVQPPADGAGYNLAGANTSPSTPVAPASASSTPAPPQPMAQPTYAGRETPTKQLFDRITAEMGHFYVGQDELVLGTVVGRAFPAATS